MNQLNIEEVQALGSMVGLEIDEPRAKTIASRLSGIIDELDDIPENLLMSAEPAHIFSSQEEA